MPYIPADHRQQYQYFLPTLFEKMSASNWQESLLAFIFQVSELVYGTATDTRYFKQNELGGVFACMSLEWQLRCGISRGKILSLKLKTGQPEINTLATLFVKLIPLEDETLRAGHLNYFITISMIHAIERSWTSVEQVPDFIDSVARIVYKTITRPYEEIAANKNGEVFPESLLSE